VLGKNDSAPIAKRFFITPLDPNYDLFQARPDFVAKLQELLPDVGTSVKEFDLIQGLQASGCFDGWISADPTLALFQKHFAVMHTLYRLSDEYAQRGWVLQVSPLRIEWLKASTGVAGSELRAGAEGVGAFYLDWNNFAAATPSTVATLLKSFWQRFAAVDQTQAALQALDLNSQAGWPEIQSQYRRLAAEHHPDKGGDSTRFTQVREAYETLKKIYT
jgi:hypothetical protein